MSRIFCRCAAFLYLFLSIAAPSWCQQAVPQAAPPQAANAVPVMDGGAGPCSLDLQVKGPDNKPVYAVKINVHITYGFAGIKRLDLEAYTNADGLVRFTGLPSRVNRPPLEFRASKDFLQGVATYNPVQECHAKHEIALKAEKPAETH